MSFLFLMVLFAAIAAALLKLARRGFDHRDAMRIGAAAAFVFTGIDHFASAQHRYAPMLPDLLAPHALPIVWIIGALELAGAVGLLMPVSVGRRVGFVDVRRAAAIGLALLMAGMVVANVNVALKGQGVAGMDFGAWYFWLRPLLQPVLIAWVLYAARVVDLPVGAGRDRPLSGR